MPDSVFGWVFLHLNSEYHWEKELYQNLVFLELKRQEFEIFYWRDDKNEVDFIVRKGTNIEFITQVCWNIKDNKTRKREIKGLVHACKKFGLNNGKIDDKTLDKYIAIISIRTIFTNTNILLLFLFVKIVIFQGLNLICNLFPLLTR